MESNTDRIHRVLLLWLELNKTVTQARSAKPAEPESAWNPWTCDDDEVREVWQSLTAPENLLALEQWLCQAAEGQPAEWARKALQACRERAGYGGATAEEDGAG
jgi:hypothetical protein